MADQFGAPGELNRALADGNMTISGVGAMDAGQCQAQLGGLKTINQRGFAEGTGKKKALLVGINYPGTEAALNGCINDVRNMYNFIKTNYSFDPANIMVLTDDNPNPAGQPTAQNIVGAIGWLVNGAAPGDSLFMHYSGHGGSARGRTGTMQTIIPSDYKRTGQISDLQLHDMICKKIPTGCQMTAIFDSCHSGSVLNLPYSFIAAASRDINAPQIMQVNGQTGVGASLLSMTGAWGNNADTVNALLAQLHAQGYAAQVNGRDLVTANAIAEAQVPKHTIQAGDTLWNLAQQGKAASVDVLLAANPGIDPEMLMPGQVINLSTVPVPVDAPLIFAGGMSTYTIQQGDTYWLLTQKGKAPSVEALVAANPGVNPENLQIGQTINVPVSAAAGTGGTRSMETNHVPYTIVPGDTYHGLVQRGYAPSVEALNAVNPGLNPENLQIGQVIQLPASDADRGFGSLLAALLGGFVSPQFSQPVHNPAVPPPQPPAGGGAQSMTGLHVDITKGTCIQFSGCQDDQTSADATIGGKPTGALSWAFLTAMAQMQRPSYEQLIIKIRSLLQGKFTQIPQLSTGYPMDLKAPFAI